MSSTLRDLEDIKLAIWKLERNQSSEMGISATTSDRIEELEQEEANLKTAIAKLDARISKLETQKN